MGFSAAFRGGNQPAVLPFRPHPTEHEASGRAIESIAKAPLATLTRSVGYAGVAWRKQRRGAAGPRRAPSSSGMALPAVGVLIQLLIPAPLGDGLWWCSVWLHPTPHVPGWRVEGLHRVRQGARSQASFHSGWNDDREGDAPFATALRKLVARPQNNKRRCDRVRRMMPSYTANSKQQGRIQMIKETWL